MKPILSSHLTAWLLAFAFLVVSSVSAVAKPPIIGIGATLDRDAATNSVRIVKVLPNSPASKKGLAVGSVIQKIGDVPTAGKNVDECIGLIRGAEGTIVRLEIIEPIQKRTIQVELVRQPLDIPLVKEVVTTLKQHEEFFAELRQFESLAASAEQANQKSQKLDAEKQSIPGKGEFETTAEYQQRVNTTKARIETGQREAVADAATSSAKSLVVSDAIRQKQAGLDGLVTCLKVKMGPYDADNRKIALFTPEPFVFGSYNERTAIATAKEAMPAYSCSADVARQLREASDKGELYCTVQFESPKLKLAHAPFALPATGGDKWGEALGKLGLAIIVNAIDPSKVNQVPTNISDTKTHDANTIQIEGYSSLQFLNFFNKSGAILAQ